MRNRTKPKRLILSIPLDKNLPVFLFLSGCLISVLLNGCAKIGSPQGGPEDTSPPFYVASEPQNKAVHFDGDEIEIEFNEYIQLNNLNDEMLVSPPLEQRPVVRIRNKSLVIELNNDLASSTTYTMNFGNSILDNNAGNALPGFEFVFSTGDYIDSLAVTGETLAAFNHQPPGNDEEVYVMLYSNLNDSAPLLELPRYIGRAGDNGHFSINNIHTDTFRAIALMDMNGNLMYDPVTDAIGFADSLVFVSPATVQDVHLITDTAAVADSLTLQGMVVRAVSLSLEYFVENDSRVFLNSRSRESAERISLTFTRPPYDSVRIEPLNFSTEADWYVPEYSPDMDSVTCWITDTLVSGMGTVGLIISFTTTDEAGHFVDRQDTVQLVYGRSGPVAEGIRKPGSAATVVGNAYLGLTSPVSRNRTLNLNGSVGIMADRPLAEIDTSLIYLTRTIDSLEQAVDFTLVRDAMSIRRFLIRSDWAGESQYGLLLLPGAVHDIYGSANDTLQMSFTTRPVDYYGNIKVQVEGNNFPVILQVLNDEEDIIREGYLTQSGTIEFSYMTPGNYSLKAIHDLNGNRKWDTGNYLLKIQPERTFFYDIPDETRSSWDYEYTWQIGP